MATTTLYHLLLTTHNLPSSQNPLNKVEKIRAPGIYTSLTQAQAAAHRALFDLGLERDFFTVYEVREEEFAQHPSLGKGPDAIADKAGLAVHAVARDGSVWQVRVAATPVEHAKAKGWEASWEDGRVGGGDAYLVVRTKVRGEEERGGVREHVVLGATRTLGEARRVAAEAVQALKQEGKFEVAEMDDGEELGESTVGHAVGNDGENVFVSVVKVVELEAVRVGEASMRIR
ncbi:uncharacterized protein HMPREF1541_01347 [Cyphellophora europaea CBS 101466]|uniref:Uncharacterized protein n=1 Tax=Cyphellophora europaea (strain CBS 101466) TaxID=1220924 RepID=W2SEJ6_CYPE1|nr:uncharacterized protein HMPREF1541_01347 [Cyphellophora europaea CBS 101466]ETN47156.1 hypothetical protein HMPREF1541_01347 [Cyphellophora europaea CBS 101466]